MLFKENSLSSSNLSYSASNCSHNHHHINTNIQQYQLLKNKKYKKSSNQQYQCNFQQEHITEKSLHSDHNNSITQKVNKYRFGRMSKIYELLPGRQKLLRQLKRDKNNMKENVNKQNQMLELKEKIENGKNRVQKYTKKQCIQQQNNLSAEQAYKNFKNGRNRQQHQNSNKNEYNKLKKDKNKHKQSLKSSKYEQQLSNTSEYISKLSQPLQCSNIKNQMKGLIKQNQIYKMEEVMIRNNQYFQNMHQSVVNRLLDIIQHKNQRTVDNSQPLSLAASQSKNIHQLQNNRHKCLQQNSFSTHKKQVQTPNIHQSSKKSEKQQNLKNIDQPNIIINNIYSQNKNNNKSLKNYDRYHQYQQQKINALYKQKQSYQGVYHTPRIPERFSMEVNSCQKFNTGQKCMSANPIFFNIQQKNNALKNIAITGSNSKDIQNQQTKKQSQQAHPQQKIQTPQSMLATSRSNKIQVLSNNTQQRSKGTLIETPQYLKPKPPVFIEIPVNQTQNKGISLAQAFAKKVNGKLTSQRLKTSENKVNTNCEKITQKTTNRNSKSISKPQQTQNMKISDISTVKYTNSDFKTPKSSMEPSEQLLNRLIYGSKTKVSKKEMHARTKKNYQNLPQVRKRKADQQKRQLQRQRLQKIKAYQKSIRKNTAPNLS